MFEFSVETQYYQWNLRTKTVWHKAVFILYSSLTCWDSQLVTLLSLTMHITGYFKWYKEQSSIEYNVPEINAQENMHYISLSAPSAFSTEHMDNKFIVEVYSQRSYEMTRNWPSGHMGLILYHHPHGNWLCIVLLWIISELYRGCMSHKSAQSFKVCSSGRQQWFHRD